MHKVGLLGGTFDPVHSGHLQLARAAMEEAALEKVLMIPAGGPPHKDSANITPFHHRLEMLRLAVNDEVGIELLGIEGELPKPSFTVDTVRLLRRRGSRDTMFYFIIGIDAFMDILSWKLYRELLGMVALLVARRKGFEGQRGLKDVRHALGYVEYGDEWRSPDAKMHNITFLQSEINDLSSSAVRKLLWESSSDVVGLPGGVGAYIRENGLYINPEPPKQTA